MSAALSAGVNFAVGRWRVYPRLCRVECEGDTHHLTPRAMEVLVYLAGSDGAVVSRSELLDAIWPRMTVSQDALTQCIVELRKAFGDSAKTPAVIETIPKVGIRLLPRVVRNDEIAPAAAGPAGPAVYPVSPRVAGTRVVTVTVALAFVGAAAMWLGGRLVDVDRPAEASTAPPRSIALAHYESGNDYFNRNNDRDRMVRLAAHQYELAVEADPSFAPGWAQLGMTHTALYFLGIDRTPARLEMAATSIENALRLDPASPEGHLAKANYLHRCLGDVQAAIDEFVEAERLLPASPELYLHRSSLWRRTGDWVRAKNDLERAISLDPANVFYVRQQFINHMFTRDYDAAEEFLDRLAALAPDDVSVFTDRLMLRLVAGRDMRTALQSDPVRPNAGPADARAFVYTRWLAAIFDRDYGRAEQVLLEYAEDDVVDFDLGHVAMPTEIYLGKTRMLAGRQDEAMQDFSKAKDAVSRRLSQSADIDARTEAFYRLALAEIDVGLGLTDDALQAMAEAHALVPRSKNQMDFSMLQLSSAIRILVPAGHKAQALEVLDDYLSAPGIWSAEAITADPRIDAIARDLDFLALVERHRSSRNQSELRRVARSNAAFFGALPPAI